MTTVMLDLLTPDAPIIDSISTDGWAKIPLLDPLPCASLVALYDQDRHFRSTIVMQRHGFGRGEYRYFSYPLPPIVETLGTALYEHLAPLANAWTLDGAGTITYPTNHTAYVARCHDAGQTRPTPLILRYGAGDYNCLHQDLYGAMAFPFQATIMLNEPDRDFSGGEFVLVEQRPRAQSRAEVINLRQGEAVIFPVNRRVVQGARGPYRTVMRHGVSRIRDGVRYTLGLIFHDAA